MEEFAGSRQGIRDRYIKTPQEAATSIVAMADAVLLRHGERRISNDEEIVDYEWYAPESGDEFQLYSYQQDTSARWYHLRTNPATSLVRTKYSFSLVNGENIYTKADEAEMYDDVDIRRQKLLRRYVMDCLVTSGVECPQTNHLGNGEFWCAAARLALSSEVAQQMIKRISEEPDDGSIHTYPAIFAYLRVNGHQQIPAGIILATVNEQLRDLKVARPMIEGPQNFPEES